MPTLSLHTGMLQGGRPRNDTIRFLVFVLFLTFFGSFALAASPILISLKVTPSGVSIPLGGTRRFTATGTYSDSTQQDVSSLVTWNSANAAVVEFNTQSVATALGIGKTMVSATLNSVSNSVAITVNLGIVQSAFFGMHFNPSNPVTVPYAKCRVWGVRGAYWADIEPSPGVYDFTILDTLLAEAKQSGISDGCVFTFGYFPQWASSNPADDTCDHLNSTTGSCWPPADLAFDGSGSDQTVVNAIAQIAAHVNDPAYLQTHAHIRYWEPFNEPYRSSTLSDTPCATTRTCSFNGSYAQLVRIAEDMRCVIKGAGSVDGAPCNRKPIDPGASILTPSGQAYFEANGRIVVWNFLGCGQSPRPGSGCTTSSRGSAATDVVNFHCYVWSGNADDVATYIAAARALLSPVDAAKPFFCDEGSWATTASLADPDLQAGFVARWFINILNQQVTTALWYAWDNQGWGTLWNPKGKNGCSQSTGCITKAGVAYAQVYDWLVGAELEGCQTSGGITTCTLTRANNYSALMVWDTTLLTSCDGQTSAEVCGSTPYTVPAGYSAKRDLAGKKTPAGIVEYVGAKPILLEN